MNSKTLEAITRHGQSLLAAFPNATEKDPVALCKKLRRIETSLVKSLVDYCNGTFRDNEEGTKMDAICDKALARVVKLLGIDGVFGLFINRDPRGYALKFSEEWTQQYNNKQYKYKSTHCNYCLQTVAEKAHLTTCPICCRQDKISHMGGKPIYTDMGGYGIIAPDLTEK